MTGQWEKYVEPMCEAAWNGSLPTYWHTDGSWQPMPTWDEADEKDREPTRKSMRAALEAGGPFIERDTRERLVAAAARAIEREPSPLAITTVEQLQALADRAAIHGPNAAPAVVLDSQGVPWLICINEDGDTFAQTMPDGPDTPSQHDFEGLLEHSPAGVTPVWPTAGSC